MRQKAISLPLLTAFFCFFYFNVESQISLVHDIYNVPPPYSSNPHRLTVFNNKLVFQASDGLNTHGYELWVMDDKEQLTMYEINPGWKDGCWAANDYNNYMGIANNKIFFPGNNGNTGFELFSWDGINPPALAFEAAPGKWDANPEQIVEMGGKIYYSAFDTLYGRELWMYDPVSNTGKRLSDIFPGKVESYPRNLTVFNGKLYFQARSATTGYELYVYDPATDQVSLAADIDPGVNDGYPSGLIVANGKLYFSANTTSYGRELYSFDQNNVLSRLTDLHPGSESSMFRGFDGQKEIGLLNDKLVFAANDGTMKGQHMYEYDIASGNVKNIGLLHTASATYNFPPTFINYANKLYFSENDSVHGSELWVYDGSSAPHMIADQEPGTKNFNPLSFAVFNGALYFCGIGYNTYGGELYKYVDSTVSIHDVGFGMEAGLYPNPATGAAILEFTLKATAELFVRLTDISGKEVYSTGIRKYGPGTNRILLPLHELPQGDYFCSIKTKEGRLCYSQKVLKQ